MSDWEEVKRLAADFQKVQLGSTTQRLSERNCIEIITWLKDKKLIDLIFTVDGKECMTPDELVRVMEDELYINGGRINLVDLAKIIGVDYAHINNLSGTVLRNNKSLHLVLGQMIDSSYVNKIVAEINEKLTQLGQINVADLIIQYDLPAEFLQQILEKNLGKLLIGKQDPNDHRIFFTESFIARSLAKIRGALMGLTRPIAVATLLNYIDVSERLFFSLFDQVGASGSLTSRQVGAQYIPNIYAKSQNDWVRNFFTQNLYLEFDALKRVGLTDYKTYVKKQFPGEKFLVLNSCLISNELLDRVLDEIEDCISSKSHTDIPSILPSVFNEEDIKIITDNIMTPQRKQQILILDKYAVSLAFIDKLTGKSREIAEENAKRCVDNGKYQEFKMKLLSAKLHKQEEFEEKSDKREERRKKASSGKAGGGAQGRETKTKSTKKTTKHATKSFDTETVDGAKLTLELVTPTDVINAIRDDVEEAGLNELFETLTEYILPRTNEVALGVAEQLYAATLANQSANRRQNHNELEMKLNQLIGDVRLYEKGIKLLPVDLQNNLYKYLLKTVCTDVVTEILNYTAQENNSQYNSATLTNQEQRLKFLNELQPDLRAALLPLTKSLPASTIDEFMASVDEALDACNMILKKVDKKKDRVLVLNHKHVLLEQLNRCDDLAVVLHLAVLVVFTTATQCMLHASGRHLQQILAFLKQYLSAEQFGELSTYHDYVGLMLSGGSEEENVRQKLKEMVPTIRTIANDFKKPTQEKS